MKYLIFTLDTKSKNEASFNSWLRIANSFYKYPNSTGSDKYTEPVYHPDGTMIAMPLLDSDVSELNQVRFRGKMPFVLNIVDELPSDWYSNHKK